MAKRKRRGERALLQTALRGGAAGMLGGLAITLVEREVLDLSEINALIEGRELPSKTPTPPRGGGEELQKVLKPEPGRQPGIQPAPGTA